MKHSLRESGCNTTEALKQVPNGLEFIMYYKQLYLPSSKYCMIKLKYSICKGASASKPICNTN
jgi:hypothetical protein